MGGGKSRALCEEAYQAALDYPGIEIIVARQQHTDIVGSTRKTMFREVLPLELVKYCRIVKSGGFDFIEFPNGSIINFVGLNNPTGFHSAEFGLVILDEAHEIDKDTVQTLQSRLRQKCANCLEQRLADCTHMPHRVLCAANPENPGHWLHSTYILDADPTEWGYYKAELRFDPESDPIGSAEFIKALATDNPYLPRAYVERNLGGMETHWRRRYLEGEWLFIDGTCAFDLDALTEYKNAAPSPIDQFNFQPKKGGREASFDRSKKGRVRVYRESEDGHSYAIGADTSTGRGEDYSCAYVVDLSDMALVAEYHGKLDADIFARDLHFLGRWYETAIIAVESAGGWGEPVIISLRDGKGGRPPYPRMYRHQLDSSVDMDTMQRYGFPVNSKTRPHIIALIKQAVRERSLPWMTSHLANECATFCDFEDGRVSPRAQPNCHDDAVMAAAITLELYRKRGKHPDREARIAKRKRFRPKLTAYPWQRAPEPSTR
jgi:hypothetical protein